MKTVTITACLAIALTGQVYAASARPWPYSTPKVKYLDVPRWPTWQKWISTPKHGLQASWKYTTYRVALDDRQRCCGADCILRAITIHVSFWPTCWTTWTLQKYWTEKFQVLALRTLLYMQGSWEGSKNFCYGRVRYCLALSAYLKKNSTGSHYAEFALPNYSAHWDITWPQSNSTAAPKTTRKRRNAEDLEKDVEEAVQQAFKNPSTDSVDKVIEMMLERESALSGSRSRRSAKRPPGFGVPPTPTPTPGFKYTNPPFRMTARQLRYMWLLWQDKCCRINGNLGKTGCTGSYFKNSKTGMCQMNITQYTNREIGYISAWPVYNKLLVRNGLSATKHLEVMRYGVLVPVCPEGFHQVAANAACKQLGMEGAESFHAVENTLNDGKSGVAFNCPDNATTLLDCQESLKPCKTLVVLRCTGASEGVKGAYPRVYKHQFTWNKELRRFQLHGKHPCCGLECIVRTALTNGAHWDKCWSTWALVHFWLRELAESAKADYRSLYKYKSHIYSRNALNALCYQRFSWCWTIFGVLANQTDDVNSKDFDTDHAEWFTQFWSYKHRPKRSAQEEPLLQNFPHPLGDDDTHSHERSIRSLRQFGYTVDPHAHLNYTNKPFRMYNDEFHTLLRNIDQQCCPAYGGSGCDGNYFRDNLCQMKQSLIFTPSPSPPTASPSHSTTSGSSTTGSSTKGGNGAAQNNNV